MPDEWKQISDLYYAALKLPESERAAFLQTCNASEGVRREVASLRQLTLWRASAEISRAGGRGQNDER